MEWHPELPSIIKVVDKKTKENLKIKLNTKGMGIFHFGNAFEIVAGSYSNILHHVDMDHVTNISRCLEFQK